MSDQKCTKNLLYMYVVAVSVLRALLIHVRVACLLINWCAV